MEYYNNYRRLSSELKYDEAHKLGSLVSFNKNMKTMVVMHGFLSEREFLMDFETGKQWLFYTQSGTIIFLVGVRYDSYVCSIWANEYYCRSIADLKIFRNHLIAAVLTFDTCSF